MSPREAAVAALAGLLASLPELPTMPGYTGALELPGSPGSPALPASPALPSPKRPAKPGTPPVAGNAPADQWLREFFRSQPGLGKRDRTQVGDRVFAVLRNLRLYAELARVRHPSARHPSDPDRLTPGRLPADRLPPDRLALDRLARDLIDVDAELGGGRPGNGDGACEFSGPLSKDAMSLAAGFGEPVLYSLPDWLWAGLQSTHGDRAAPIALALLQPAPIEVRVNLLVGKAQALQRLLADRGVEAVGIEGVPTGLRVSGRPGLETLDLFARGWFEVQDAGSQRIVDACEVRRGQLVVDFCAGSGGKALAIAARMRNLGKVLAFDTGEERLSRLMPRAKRAGVDIVVPMRILGVADARLARYRDRADVVLVDAPCSGTGTLRRSPDLKWRLSRMRLQQHVQEQKAILAAASKLVKPGGRLVYATCSLLQEENEQQVENFKAAGFRFVDNASWLPDEVPSSGFFYARWQFEA